MASLTPSDRRTIDKFCYQCLQLQSPDYPDAGLMRRAEVQDEIFDRICQRECSAVPNLKFQLRILKKLAALIEAGMIESESDEYEISDRIMERIGELVSLPIVPDAESVQMKSLVSYRLSLLQPPVFIDMLEKQGLIAAAGTTGLRTWEAALHLGQYLCTERNLVAGKRVLELGAGTGYLSLVCAKYLGARHVIASDGSEEVVDALPDNFVLNDVRWGYDASSSTSSSSSDVLISPKLVKWGHALLGTEEPEWNGGMKMDLVLGADITYDHRVINALLSTLDELFSLNQRTIVLIAATERNADTVAIFREACARSRLVVEEVVFTVDVCHDQSDSSRIVTPFYHTNAPIRIYRITATVLPKAADY